MSSIEMTTLQSREDHQNIDNEEPEPVMVMHDNKLRRGRIAPLEIKYLKN